MVQPEPRLERVDRHDEQNPHDPSLLRGVRVKSEVLVDLQVMSYKIHNAVENIPT